MLYSYVILLQVFNSLCYSSFSEYYSMWRHVICIYDDGTANSVESFVGKFQPVIVCVCVCVCVCVYVCTYVLCTYFLYVCMHVCTFVF